MKYCIKTCLSVSMILIVSSLNTFAQPDSVIFINGDYITGAVESMDRGIIAISTDYSDSDFMIEWEKVTEIYTTTLLMVSLDDGEEYYTTIHTSAPGRITITPVEGEPLEVGQEEIVKLNPLSKAFLDRLSANVDVGYSLTKAQNVKQLNVRGAVGYKAPRWSTDISYNTNRSDQDSVQATKRTDAAVNFRYNLIPRIFTIATVSFLSNTEQLLDLRSNAQLGAGVYVVRSNRAFWSGKLGVNRNMEQYSDPANDRDSWEGYMGTEIDLYDIGDLSLLSTLMVYPGFTETGRWRSDVNFDVKYEFPLDFYISAGFSLNWDNQPVDDAPTTDYVLQLGFGWEW